MQSFHSKMYMYRRIVEAKLFIDQHYYEKINLNKIANQAYFSKYHFLRLFKEAKTREKAVLQKPLHFIPNCFVESFGWKK